MSVLASLDFEEGSLADYASTSSAANYTIAADGAAAKAGSYGARSVASSASDSSGSASGRKSVTVGSTGDLGVDFWVRFPSWTGGGYGTITSKSIAHLQIGAEKSVWLPISSTRTIRVATQSGSFTNVQVGAGSVSLADNTWYKFRVEIRNRNDATPSADIKVSYSTDGVSWTTLVDEAAVSSRAGRAGTAADWDFGIFHANQWEQARYTVDIDAIELWDVNPPAGGVTGSGAVTAPAATVAGAGSFAIAGSGAVVAAPATVAGAGTLAIAGAGAVSSAPAAVAGSGSLAIAGSGAVVAAPATVAGAGTLAIAGAGAVSSAPAAVAGSGSLAIAGSGAVVAAPATVAGEGSSDAAVVGVGAVVAAPATVAGAGTLAITGSGGVTAAAATITGAGTIAIAGVADVAAAPATIAGVGAIAIEGVGAVTAAAATIAGSSVALETPAWRRWEVPSADRRLVVSVEDRRWSVPASDRRWVVPAE